MAQLEDFLIFDPKCSLYPINLVHQRRVNLVTFAMVGHLHQLEHLFDFQAKRDTASSFVGGWIVDAAFC